VRVDALHVGPESGRDPIGPAAVGRMTIGAAAVRAATLAGLSWVRGEGKQTAAANENSLHWWRLSANPNAANK